MTEEPQRGPIDDLWSWIDQDEPSPDAPEIPPSDVVAVMVVHNAGEWLPRQLLSLAGLDPRPGRLVAVDTGSTDGSRELLERARAEGVLDDVLIADREATFGEAVEAALADSEPAWIWLLHDDSAPRRDTLARLLDGARRADVVVPKLLEPRRRNYPETISEIGQAITPGGRRVPLVEEGEIDQQQTEPRDVLGASTAGLLVRGEAWREVGGLAPEVGRHRDGVDFCWRVNAVGFRVLSWPAAALTHRRAGRTGERPQDRHPHEVDRLAALRVAGSRGASGPALALGSWARAAGFLLGKSPSHAAAEVRAWRRYRRSGDITAALASRMPPEDLTPDDLLPSRFWTVRDAVDRFGAGLADRYRDLTDREADTSIDELTGDDFAGHLRRRRVSPVAILVVVLLLAGALAGRGLLGFGEVAGGGLLPAPDSWGGAWQAYLSGDAPWLLLTAAAPLTTLGNPGWFSVLALLLAPLLAGGSALSLLRRLDVDATAAAAVAAAWAGATIVLGLVTAGDVSGMILAVAGPLLARSLISVARDRSAGAERLRAPAGAAFWLIICTAFWPAALMLATLLGAFWAVRDRHNRLLSAAVAILPPWLFIGPWLPRLIADPGRWLTGADPLAWPDYPPASYAVALGRILPSGLPVWANALFFVTLGLLAAAGLARLGRDRWLNAVLAIAVPLLVGTLLSRFVVPIGPGAARPLLSPWALLVVAALLAPVVAAVRGGAGRRLVAALAAASLVAVSVWAVWGFSGPVQRSASSLPGYVRDVVGSARDTRVLLIELGDDDEVSWNVVDQRQPQWGSGERHPAGAFADDLYVVAQSIVSGSVPDTLADDLRRLGVSHLWLSGFGPDQRAALDNAGGITSAAADERSVVYTVVGLVSRAYVVDGADREPVLADVVGPGAEGRLLEVAEPGDARWVARLDGTSLDAVEGAERLTFELGERSGELELVPEPRWGRFTWHVAVLVALALLASPSMGSSTAARRGY